MNRSLDSPPKKNERINKNLLGNSYNLNTNLVSNSLMRMNIINSHKHGGGLEVIPTKGKQGSFGGTMLHFENKIYI